MVVRPRLQTGSFIVKHTHLSPELAEEIILQDAFVLAENFDQWLAYNAVFFLVPIMNGSRIYRGNLLKRMAQPAGKTCFGKIIP